MLDARQACGEACVWCGLDYGQPAGLGVEHVPVGRSKTGSQVFACRGRCAEGFTSFLAVRAVNGVVNATVNASVNGGVNGSVTGGRAGLRIVPD